MFCSGTNSFDNVVSRLWCDVRAIGGTPTRKLVKQGLLGTYEGVQGVWQKYTAMPEGKNFIERVSAADLLNEGFIEHGFGTAKKFSAPGNSTQMREYGRNAQQQFARKLRAATEPAYTDPTPRWARYSDTKDRAHLDSRAAISLFEQTLAIQEANRQRSAFDPDLYSKARMMASKIKPTPRKTARDRHKGTAGWGPSVVRAVDQGQRRGPGYAHDE